MHIVAGWDESAHIADCPLFDHVFGKEASNKKDDGAFCQARGGDPYYAANKDRL